MSSVSTSSDIGGRGPPRASHIVFYDRALAQDIIQALLVGIAEVAPEGALSALLTDVLAEPGNWDTTLVGLQALQVILFAGPRQSSSSRAGSNPEVYL